MDQGKTSKKTYEILDSVQKGGVSQTSYQKKLWKYYWWWWGGGGQETNSEVGHGAEPDEDGSTASML